MEWTTDHDVLFCREIIVSQPYQHKFGTRERGQCWEKVASILNGVDKPAFRVDSRALRDHINKLLSKYSKKKANEIKASGTETELTELDVLLEEIQQLKNDSDLITSQAKENKIKKLMMSDRPQKVSDKDL